MITKEMLPEIKKIVSDFNNPIFQRYLKSEMACHHTCPVCNAGLQDYTSLFYHINNKHKDKKDTQEVKNALNPLYKVRKLFDNKIEEAPLTLGQFFAEIITSPFNKHVLVNIIGKTGMGKSYSSMYLGEQVSKCVANLKGGDPEQYFSVGNIAIMKLDSVIPILEDIDQRKYNIIILDDIGASYSAREFNSAVNKNINKIFQTFRDTNTMVILNMPDTFLIDKVARKLAHYMIEIVEARHAQGISIGKLFEVEDKYRKGGKAHYHYIQHNGIKYTRVIFKRPSNTILADYDRKRKGIRQSMMADSIEAIKQADSGIKNKNTNEEITEKIPKYILIAQEMKNILAKDPAISNTKLSEKLLTSRNTIIKTRQYLNSSGGL